jgi:prefoldin subunit 5
MTNEEIQRVMEFIIKQQGSLSEKLEQFSDKLEQTRELHEQRISKLETAFVGLFGVVTDIGKAQATLTERVTQLADAQAQLIESLAHTDQRVNVPIDIIEQGRDGKSQP